MTVREVLLRMTVREVLLRMTTRGCSPQNDNEGVLSSE